MTVGEIIGEPIELFGTETGEAKEEKIYKLCGMWRKELSFPL